MICFVVYEYALSQSLTVDYIDNWINLCEPELDLSKKDKLYVIEGLLYEGKGLKEKLREFDVSDKHFYLDYLNSDSVETTFLKPNLIVVLILNVTNSNLIERKKELEAVKNRFIDQYEFRSQHIMTNSKDPVLYVDGNKIHHAEAMKEVTELKAKEIQFIVSVNHAPTSYYGQNAKNGLVRIYTKNKVDNKSHE